MKEIFSYFLSKLPDAQKIQFSQLIKEKPEMYQFIYEGFKKRYRAAAADKRNPQAKI